MTAQQLVRLYPRAWRERYGDEFVETVGRKALNPQQVIDIIGGALDNTAEAIQGKPPVFTRIVVGIPDPQGVLQIPELGIFVDNVTVTVAATQRPQRPFFYVSAYQPAQQPANKAAYDAIAALPPD